jgi:hypothetical protein
MDIISTQIFKWETNVDLHVDILLEFYDSVNVHRMEEMQQKLVLIGAPSTCVCIMDLL